MARDVSLKFRKMNGLGNEIVVVDVRENNHQFTTDQAAAIASLPQSHFDQMMVLHPAQTSGTDAFIRIYNTDGSPAEACGNGMRCVALTEFERSGNRTPYYETAAGVLGVAFNDQERISVDMGTPGLRWEDIPTRDPFHNTKRIELQVGPIDDPILHSPSVCSMGNPHAIFWVDDDLDSYDLARVGPLLEHHPMFPEGANISIAKVQNRTRCRVRTWERGAGLTQACGSAACATLVAGARLDFLDRKAEIVVPGGPLLIEWRDDDHVIMTGPAELEHEGTLTVHASGEVTLS